MSQKSVTLQFKISFNYKISLQKDENNENPGRHFDIQRQLEHFLCLLPKEETRCRIAELRFEE